jgi:hypothetical protein
MYIFCACLKVEMDFLALEDGIEMLPRNVGKSLPLDAA